jgi:hypothetical protein
VTSQLTAQDQGCVVAQSIKLRGVGASFAQVCVDPRLTSAVRQRMRGKGDWSTALPETMPAYREFQKRPPTGARVVLKNVTGEFTDERRFDSPLLTIAAWSSVAFNIVLVTEDMSTGPGAGRHVRTTLWWLNSGRMTPHTAIDDATRREVHIELVESERSDWRITSNSITRGEIVAISSHAREDGSFETEYARYYVARSQWRRARAVAEGPWDTTYEFPPLDWFP